MAETKYRAAVIGCGGRGRSHAAAYSNIGEADLVACCDLAPDRREPVAEQFGIPAYADADSAQFIRRARSLAGDRGYQVANCDVTILVQRPKLGPYKAAMRQRLADLLGVSVDDVAVKAKTNEQMGFVGRGEGIAAMAVVLLTDAC